jgi:uncharacterized protein YwgA
VALGESKLEIGDKMEINNLNIFLSFVDIIKSIFRINPELKNEQYFEMVNNEADWNTKKIHFKKYMIQNKKIK